MPWLSRSSGTRTPLLAAASAAAINFQVGPTIRFECSAQIPRSFLRSFSLWARHPAETSAERNVRLGAAEFFPVASRQVRRVRKRRREGNEWTARVERRTRYNVQTGRANAGTPVT